MGALRSIVDHIEHQLCWVYELRPDAHCSDFIITEDNLSPELASILSQQGIAKDRAATIFHPQPDNLDINVYLSSALVQQLEDQDPLEALNRRNLDSFCALAEEVSHFHFIIDHYQRTVPFSLLELEWQGEVDRFFASALLLQEQSGHSHHRHLLEVFTSHSMIADLTHVERYREASQLAGRFIASYLKSQRRQGQMKDVYRAPWQKKAQLSR